MELGVNTFVTKANSVTCRFHEYFSDWLSLQRIFGTMLYAANCFTKNLNRCSFLLLSKAVIWLNSGLRFDFIVELNGVFF